MFTRNHPTDQPKSTRLVSFHLVSGRIVTVQAHYGTTGNLEPEGGSYQLWVLPDAGGCSMLAKLPERPPVLVAIFRREHVAGITIH